MSTFKSTNPNYRSRLNKTFLTCFFLAFCIGRLLTIANQANADCSPAAADNTTVTCVETGGDHTSTIGTSIENNVIINIDAGATVRPTSGDAIYVDGDGIVTNNGTLDGPDDGLDCNDNLTVTNTGTIIGASEGVRGDNNLVITNSGSITGGTGDGIITGSSTATGFQLTNTGTITSDTADGVDANDGTIINSGTISGAQDGIQVDDKGATITNDASGEIISTGTSANYYAVDFQNTSNTEDSSVINHGSIISSAGGIRFFGDATNDSLTNSGSISSHNGSTSETTVSMGGGNDFVTIEPGSTISGLVDAGSGTDALILSGNSGNESFSFSKFINFESLEVKNGSIWTLSGSGSFTNGITLNGGTLKGTPTLNGDLMVASGTVAPGNSVGTLTVNGDVSFASESNLEIEITSSTADKIVITGGLTITSGATLTVKPAADEYNLGTYDLITTTTGITGSFGDPTVESSENLNGKKLSLNDSGNTLQLVVESTETKVVNVTPTVIPTLNNWGIIALALLLTLSVCFRSRWRLAV